MKCRLVSLVVLDEKLVDDFATYMKKFPELYSSLADVVCSFLPESQEPMLIVDVGVGPGFLAAFLQQKVPDVQVFGVDVERYMLKKAVEHTDSKGFSAVLSGVEALPFHNGMVDVVVSRYSLSYWRHPEDVFHELFRILKPGGVVVVEALNKRFSRLRLLIICLRMLFRGASWGVVRYHWKAFSSAYSFGEVEGFLRQNGFILVGREGGAADWRFLVVGTKHK